MPNTRISKHIDIYKFPTEFEISCGSITIGDLHGNAVKLLHFLLRHGVLQFKSSVKNPEQQYGEFVQKYEAYGFQVLAYLTIHEKLITIQASLRGVRRDIKAFERINAIDESARTESQQNRLANLNIINLQKKLARLETTQQEQLKKKDTYVEKMIDIVPFFNHFISLLEIRYRNILVRLIGDEFADRGSCDYFTLKLLELLSKNQVKTTVITSNHGIEFVYALEHFINHGTFSYKNYVLDPDKPSIFGLQLLFDKKKISIAEIKDIAQTSYLPNLKIIDYTLNETGITLFTHAPVKFDAIKALANRLNVPFKDLTKEELGTTIDNINSEFQNYVKTNRVHELLQLAQNLSFATTHMTSNEMTQYPFLYFCWNRWNETKDTKEARPSTHNGYDISYYHGHDEFNSSYEHVGNLDTPCGKFLRNDPSFQDRVRKLKIKAQNESDKDHKSCKKFIESMDLYTMLDSDEQAEINNEKYYLIQGNAEQILTSFGQDFLLTRSENAAYAIERDVNRIMVLGSANQLEEIINQWLSQNDPYYAQGDFDARNLFFIFGMYPFLQKDEDLYSYQQNLATLSFGFLSDKQEPSAIMVKYRKDKPGQWLLALVKNTHLPPQERTVFLLSNVDFADYVKIPNEQLKPMVFNSPANPKLQEVFKQQSNSRLVNHLLPYLFISDTGKINPKIQGIERYDARGTSFFQKIQLPLHMIVQATQQELDNLQSFSNLDVDEDIYTFAAQDTKEAKCFRDIIQKTEAEHRVIANRDQIAQWDEISTHFRKSLYKIAYNGLTKSGTIQDIQAQIKAEEACILKIVDPKKTSYIQIGLIALANIVIAVFTLFIANLVNNYRNNNFLFFTETAAGREIRALDADVIDLVLAR